jgi:FlaG/FlaF family flagellin (archaellin)
MKKIVYLFSIIAFVTVLFGACGSSSNTPGAAAEKIAKATQKGDFKTIVNNMHIAEEGQSAEDIQMQKDMFINILEEKAKETIDENGGIKSYEVLEEKVADDGKTAKVKMKYVYENGSEETENMSFVNIDGKWLLEIDK